MTAKAGTSKVAEASDLISVTKMYTYSFLPSIAAKIKCQTKREGFSPVLVDFVL